MKIAVANLFGVAVLLLACATTNCNASPRNVGSQVYAQYQTAKGKGKAKGKVEKRSNPNKKAVQKKLERLCENDDAIFRTCLASDGDRAKPGNGGKNGRKPGGSQKGRINRCCYPCQVSKNRATGRKRQRTCCFRNCFVKGKRLRKPNKYSKAKKGRKNKKRDLRRKDDGLTLTRLENGKIKGLGLVPPKDIRRGFDFFSVDVVLSFLNDGVAADLSDCNTRLDLEKALLEFLVDVFDTKDQHVRCAAIENVGSGVSSGGSSMTGGRALKASDEHVATATALTTSVSVELSQKLVERIEGTNSKRRECDAESLVQCCLQNEINGDTRGQCEIKGCRINLCSSLVSPTRTAINGCDTSEGLLPYLQCAAIVDSLDDVEEGGAEVVLDVTDATTVAECVAKREAIIGIENTEERFEACETFFNSECASLNDIEAELLLDLCPPPPPETSTVLEASEEVCTIPVELDDSVMGGLTAFTQGSDGLFYGIASAPSGTILYILDITSDTFSDGSPDCGIAIVRSCEFEGRQVEAIAQAEPSSFGATNLFIAGVEINGPNVVPFISRVSADCVEAENGEQADDFLLEAEGTFALSDLPFFSGLTIEPILRREVWAASRTSLFSGASDRQPGESKYFLTRFDTVTATPTAEFTYFVDTDGAVEANRLEEILALDDYGSFLTIETGIIREEGLRTSVPSTSIPTFVPTRSPSMTPTVEPSTSQPTLEPTTEPTTSPTEEPTVLRDPSSTLISGPTSAPTLTPAPTFAPTSVGTPTSTPTRSPAPTRSPTRPPIVTTPPTRSPKPTASPVTESPTIMPTFPVSNDFSFSMELSQSPTTSKQPTVAPTNPPTISPSTFSQVLSQLPSRVPSADFSEGPFLEPEFSLPFFSFSVLDEPFSLSLSFTELPPPPFEGNDFPPSEAEPLPPFEEEFDGEPSFDEPLLDEPNFDEPTFSDPPQVANEPTFGDLPTVEDFPSVEGEPADLGFEEEEGVEFLPLGVTPTPSPDLGPPRRLQSERRGTCIFRTYTDELFASDGVARKDLIECFEDDFEAAAFGFNDIFSPVGEDNEDEIIVNAAGNGAGLRGAGGLKDDGGLRRRMREEKRRALQLFPGLVPQVDRCTDVADNARVLLLQQESDGTQFIEVRNYPLAQTHFLTCRDCTVRLNDAVEIFLSINDLRNNTGFVENRFARSLLTRTSRAMIVANRFEPVVNASGLATVREECGTLNTRMENFDRSLSRCQQTLDGYMPSDNQTCPEAAATRVDEWDARSVKIQLCCREA